MPTPLANAVNVAFNSLAFAGGVCVTYTQGLTIHKNVEALPGRTDTESQFSDGTIRTSRMADFIVPIESLFGLVPMKGDTIVWDDRKYEVMHPAGGRVYDEMGPYKQLYRIHTKEVYAS